MVPAAAVKVAVLGLGYVGCVTAACLAARGNAVVGVDADRGKVDDLRRGNSPIVEPGLDALIREQVESGRLTATPDLGEALAGADVALVCVGTPSRSNGGLDLSHVRRVCEQLGAHIGSSPRRVVVAVRSTVLPGSVAATVVPALESSSGRRAGIDFGVAMCPEFLRETTAIGDFFDPPFTVVGASDDWVHGILRELFSFLDAPVHEVDLSTAECVKYASNAWHATKVAFANEIARTCAGSGVDPRVVMDLFAQDNQLNISARYLRPGFAFGGSCLPKDVRALVHLAREVDAQAPLLEAVLESNRRHVERAVSMVLEAGVQDVALLGLSFKAGTDDLRESPYVTVAETLLGKGVRLRIFDPSLEPARLIGANRHYMSDHLPHLASLLVDDAEAALREADAVVLGSVDANGIDVLRTAAVPRVFDLSGQLPAEVERRLRQTSVFRGLAW